MGLYFTGWPFHPLPWAGDGASGKKAAHMAHARRATPPPCAFPTPTTTRSSSWCPPCSSSSSRCSPSSDEQAARHSSSQCPPSSGDQATRSSTSRCSPSSGDQAASSPCSSSYRCSPCSGDQAADPLAHPPIDAPLALRPGGLLPLFRRPGTQPPCSSSRSSPRLSRSGDLML
jgi:hypothetical protein